MKDGELAQPAEASWVDETLSLLTAYRDVLLAHPGLAKSAVVMRSSGPGFIALCDRLMGLLISGGIAPDRAGWGIDLLLLTVTAIAAEHGAPAPGELDKPDQATASNDLQEAVLTADPDVTPHVAAHGRTILAGTPQQRWSWFIRAQITGIAGTATSTGTDPN